MKADFHIHSKYSDGDASPREIVELAIDLGLDAVGIVDHVNTESTWVRSFSEVICEIQKEYSDRIRILSGLEAKCLDMTGRLDIPLDAADSVDFVVGAIHRVPDSIGYMKSDELANNSVKALRNWTATASSMLRNPRVNVWAHPGRILMMNGVAIPISTWRNLSKVASISRKYVEFNTSGHMANSMPVEVFFENGANLVPASDSHSLEEMASNCPRLTCCESAVHEFLSHFYRKD